MQKIKRAILSASILISTLAVQAKLVETAPSFYYLEEATQEGHIWVRSCRHLPTEKAQLQGDDLFIKAGLDCTRIAQIAQSDLDTFLQEMESQLPGGGLAFFEAILGLGLMVGAIFLGAKLKKKTNLDRFMFFLGIGSVFKSAYDMDKGQKQIDLWREFQAQIQSNMVGRVEHQWALEVFTDFINSHGTRPNKDALATPAELN